MTTVTNQPPPGDEPNPYLAPCDQSVPASTVDRRIVAGGVVVAISFVFWSMGLVVLPVRDDHSRLLICIMVESVLIGLHLLGFIVWRQQRLRARILAEPGWVRQVKRALCFVTALLLLGFVFWLLLI